MMRDRRSLLPVLLIVPFLAGCGSREEAPAGDSGRSGVVVVRKPGLFAAEPEGALTTPAGRIVEPGTRDSLGWVLPLDVRRPKRKGPPRGAAPSRDAIDASRKNAPRTPFEEHRLGPDDGHTQNETTIGVSGETLVAGWNNYTDATLVMGVARSVDGGHTWSDTLFGGHSFMSDPAVRPGGDGRWYYAYLAGGGSGGSDADIYVRRSLDDGATWSAPTLVTSNYSFDDKPYIDAAGEEVLVAWADFSVSPSDVRVARSLDGGVTFGASHLLSVNGCCGNGPCPVIGPDGAYYVFWRDSYQESLWVSKSIDQGTTWSPDRGIVGMSPLPSTLPGGFRIVNFPSADADPLTGDLVLLWNDQRFGDPDILAIRSSDGGAHWSAPVRVNDDATSEAQWFPWVAIDETGVVHAVWYDRRSDGYDIDVYYTRSLDGGATFEPNTRVTAAPFPPVLPWDVAIDFIGDYNGIAAGGETAYPFYQDSREGNQDVYVSLIPSVPTTVAAASGVTPAGRLAAAPAPFRDRTRISWRGFEERAFAVDLFTAGGRLVRRLPAGSGRSVEWDGRDAGGRELPAGVYFARLDRPGGRETVRLVKVR